MKYGKIKNRTIFTPIDGGPAFSLAPGQWVEIYEQVGRYRYIAIPDGSVKGMRGGHVLNSAIESEGLDNCND